MRTYPLHKEDGAIYAFEVSSLAGRRLIVRRLSKVSGVEIVRRPKWFSWSQEDSFCEFSFKEVQYEIEEP